MNSSLNASTGCGRRYTGSDVCTQDSDNGKAASILQSEPQEFMLLKMHCHMLQQQWGKPFVQQVTSVMLCNLSPKSVKADTPKGAL